MNYPVKFSDIVSSFYDEPEEEWDGDYPMPDRMARIRIADLENEKERGLNDSTS